MGDGSAVLFCPELKTTELWASETRTSPQKLRADLKAQKLSPAKP